MTTALASTTQPTVTPQQLDLIRRTVAKDATDDELQLYLYDCARQGVHPLDKLIHFTKRAGKYTPITSIDFMRAQAAATGECLGISDPVFASGAPPGSATVTVKRLVHKHVAEFTATAYWVEYLPGPGGDHMWKKMPHVMLGKCAEACALRKGFPKQLAGLYAREELDQAIEDTDPVPPGNEDLRPPMGKIDPPQDPTLPHGVVRIARVQEDKTRNAHVRRYRVILSTGEEVTTISDWLGSQAKGYQEQQIAVRIKTKKSPKGIDLVEVMPATDVVWPDPPAEAPAPAAASGPPITSDDIPF